MAVGCADAVSTHQAHHAIFFIAKRQKSVCLGRYNDCSQTCVQTLSCNYSTLLAQFLWSTLTERFKISDLTVGISVGLFVLFVGMAIYIYKPRKRSTRGPYTAVDQPMPVWIIWDKMSLMLAEQDAEWSFNLCVWTQVVAFLLWTWGIQ